MLSREIGPVRCY